MSPISLIEIGQLAETKPKELKINVPLAVFIAQALTDLGVQVLAITPERAQRFYEIQLMKDHKDQFGRTIIAQAASTGFVILSDDEKFPHYPVETRSRLSPTKNSLLSGCLACQHILRNRNPKSACRRRAACRGEACPREADNNARAD